MSLKITALVEKARDGNRPSFQDLVTIFQEDIYRLAYYRTFSQMDAEDLTQEVFEQAYRKLNSLNDPQRFRAWLYSIAVNRCNDFLRKRKYMALLQMRTAQEQDFMATGKDMNNSYNDKLRKKDFGNRSKQCCINYRPWSVKFSPAGLWTTAISMKLPPSSTRMRAQ